MYCAMFCVPAKLISLFRDLVTRGAESGIGFWNIFPVALLLSLRYGVETLWVGSKCTKCTK
jgi:hypothetical protein